MHGKFKRLTGSRTSMARVYFEATTQWVADIDPQDLADADLEDVKDTDDLRTGQVTGDLAELLEVHGVEIDGPEITITQVKRG
jgi:hypothetical protein